MAKSQKDRQKARQRAAVKRARKTKERAAKIAVGTPPHGNLPKKQSKPDFFGSLDKVIQYSDKSTYLFARLRDNGEGGTRVQTLGTAFLAGPNRMVSCHHCIHNGDGVDTNHQDGDMYLFVQKDENGLYHHSAVSVKENETLYCFPDMDLAIFYLPDEFYKVGDQWVKNPANHLDFSNALMGIGADVGVAGYPTQEIRVKPDGTIDNASFILRADRGVVNTRYTNNGAHYYEFTMAFNPGNSGGPIFDLAKGNVVGVVHGFNSFPVAKQGDTAVYASYSIGVASENFKTVAAEHGLSFT